jgi:hypothetical protein
MTHIISPTDDFDFSTIHLAYPTSIQGGAFFTKIYSSGKPLYIQTPKSLTKQGFVKSGKKIHTELMFESNEDIFIKWLENLESKCVELLFEKGDQWFQEKLDKNDIESAFTSPTKIYKSGKYYLVRCNVKLNTSTNHPSIRIYNEDETPLTMDDITFDKKIISVIEIQGIKFTSRSFQLDIEMKQVMLLDNDFIFEKCVIQPKTCSNNQIKKEEEIQIKKEEELVINSDEEDEDYTIESKKKYEYEIIDNNKKEILEKSTNIEESLDKECLEESDMHELTDLNLEELHLDNDTMILKKPQEVFYDIYRQARKKARILKHQALLAFLEAKNIKKTYKLEDLEDDDSVISDLDFKSIEETLNYNMDI